MTIFSASSQSVKIGKPEWATPNFPGVIENVPVKLETTFAEKEAIKAELKPVKALYNQSFLATAKAAWKNAPKSYQGPVDAGKEISKLLSEEDSEVLLSCMLPEGEESIEMIDSLIESKAKLTDTTTNLQALTTLKRAKLDDFDTSALTLADVEHVNPKLKVQLSVFAQAEQYGATDSYIEDGEFKFSSEEANAGAEEDHEATAKK